MKPVFVNKLKVRGFLASYPVEREETLDAFIGRSDLTEPERDYAWWYACAAANLIKAGFIGITWNFDTLSKEEKGEALEKVFEEIDGSSLQWMQIVIQDEFENQGEHFVLN